jgi:hypothetical protein
MPRIDTVNASGALQRTEQWDTVTYTARDGSGAVVEQRPVTAQEQAAAVAETAATNTGALTAQARAAVDSIIASREVLRLIKDKTNATIGPADTKDVARQLMATQKELLGVLRLTGGRVDSTDTGAA